MKSKFTDEEKQTILSKTKKHLRSIADSKCFFVWFADSLKKFSKLETTPF